MDYSFVTSFNLWIIQELFVCKQRQKCVFLVSLKSNFWYTPLPFEQYLIARWNEDLFSRHTSYVTLCISRWQAVVQIKHYIYILCLFCKPSFANVNLPTEWRIIFLLTIRLLWIPNKRNWGVEYDKLSGLILFWLCKANNEAALNW